MKNNKLTRTCIGCRKKQEKKDLIRIVKKENEKIELDLSQKLEGRGAYICKNIECFEKMVKGNKLKLALKTNVEKEKYEELRGVIFENHK